MKTAAWGSLASLPNLLGELQASEIVSQKTKEDAVRRATAKVVLGLPHIGMHACMDTHTCKHTHAHT